MDLEIQKGINTAIKKLQGIDPYLKRSIGADLGVAAKPLIAAIKAAAPVSSKAHSRYSAGKVVATYKPGNLRRSIQRLPLRRAKSAIYIGPRSRGENPDGYYAPFLEYGTQNMSARPFIGPAAKAVLPAVGRTALELLKKRIETYAK